MVARGFAGRPAAPSLCVAGRPFVMAAAMTYRDAHVAGTGTDRDSGAVNRLNWPLVGRERELTLACEQLSARATGGVVIAGEPGVGKTRLAAEIAEIAASSGRAVQWVRASRAASSIQLGAFAALLPPLDGALSGVAELLVRARQAVALRGGGEPLVLCVDDAHLLDDASAALVHQLVSGGDAFAVITIRTGEPVPDTMQALWKDEQCAFVALESLTPADLQRLLADVLGAAVDGRSAALLWELTRGNALFLRELVHHGLEQDVLVQDGGIWRWRGEAALGLRLSELVITRLKGLDAASLALLELIAVGAPLELALLDRAETAALEALEDRDLVARLDDRRRRYATVAHPLHGEVIRARVGHTRREALERRLADGVSACGARRRGDVVRVASWRLDCGGEGDCGLLLRAAAEALAMLDWTLAERLAHAALEAGGGFDARLVLARALASTGRAAGAEALLAELEGDARSDPQRLMVAIARAGNLFWGLDRTAEADDSLRRAERSIADPALRDELVALRAFLVCTLGQAPEALAAAAALLQSPQAREQTRLRAALTVATALTMRGRSDDAIAVIDEWLPAARRHRDELPMIEGHLLATRPLALQTAGRLVEATDAAQRSYEFELAARSPQGTAFAAFAVGSAWLTRGRVQTALRWFRESAALARDSDAIGFLHWPLAGIAQAAAQAGDLALADATLAEVEATPVQGTRTFEAALELTRAWCAAAAGERSRACELALAAAQHAAALGQDGIAVRALHDVVRLGDPAGVAARLGALAGDVDGPFARIAAAHASALLLRDGDALLEVAEAFCAADALLPAAEAADAAAIAYRESGHEASARAAAHRSAALLDGCEGARPPTVFGAQIVDELTSREREVALIAATGLSSREIADRLVVSIRTVDNHLLRVYRKLGITRREELTRLLSRSSE